MKKETRWQLDESWQNVKPYLKDEEKLKEMCQNCEAWCGKEHDYNECLNKPCFQFFLAYNYLEWSNSVKE